MTIDKSTENLIMQIICRIKSDNWFIEVPTAYFKSQIRRKEIKLETLLKQNSM